MIKKIALVALVVAISLVFAVPAFAGDPPSGLPGGDRVRPVIYVTSQGLYYDSIVGPSLPGVRDGQWTFANGIRTW